VIEVDKHSFGPECLAELVTAEDFVRVTEQQPQRAKGKILNLDLDAALAKLARVHVGLEHSKTD
jgi:hypothetical protein